MEQIPETIAVMFCEHKESSRGIPSLLQESVGGKGQEKQKRQGRDRQKQAETRQRNE